MVFPLESHDSINVYLLVPITCGFGFDEEIMQKIKVYRNLLLSAQSTFK
jgi:hypothetical protein